MCGALNESPEHVELSPVNFISLGCAEVGVALMSTNKIRHVYFQCGDTGSFGVFQRHPIGLVGTPVLEQNVPRQQVFVVIWCFGFEYLHRIVALKSRVVYSSDEGAEGGIIVQGAKLVCDIDEFLYLLGSILGFIVTQDQRDDPIRKMV